jgi:hypothetical protein
LLSPDVFGKSVSDSAIASWAAVRHKKRGRVHKKGREKTEKSIPNPIPSGPNRSVPVLSLSVLIFFFEAFVSPGTPGTGHLSNIHS